MGHWTDDYIGVPWAKAGRTIAGLDCWGYVWLAYHEKKNVALPRYDRETLDAAERQEIAFLIDRDRGCDPWFEVPCGSEREFDVLVFRRGRINSHVGLVAMRGIVSHVVEKSEVRNESYATGPLSMKLVSIVRHRDFK